MNAIIDFINGNHCDLGIVTRIFLSILAGGATALIPITLTLAYTYIGGNLGLIPPIFPNIATLIGA